jgi:hypothetical protein
MSIRMSEGGRLFGIMACVGGAAMIGSAGLVWKEGFFAKPNGNGYFIILRAGAYGRVMLLLGFIVIAAAATFIGVESRRIRMTAGVVVVLSGTAGLILLVLSAEPRSLASWVPARCTRSNPEDAPCIDHLANGSGAWLAGWGSIVAAGYGILALVRSRGGTPRTPVAERPVAIPSDATPTGDVATSHESPTSDTHVFGWTVVVLVIALALYSCTRFIDVINQETF